MDNEKDANVNEGTKDAKGINWLTIIGWIVLLVLIGIIIAAFWLMKETEDNPLIKSVTEMQEYLDEMPDKTKSQIEAEAEALFASDYTLENAINKAFASHERWVTMEGQIGKEETDNVAANIAGNLLSDNNYGGYVLNEAIVVIDTEQGYLSLDDGTTIKAHGRLLIVEIDDIWTLPIIGPDLQQEFDGVDLPDGIVFVISKEIDVLDGPTPRRDLADHQVGIEANGGEGDEGLVDPVADTEDVNAEGDAVEDDDADDEDDGEEPTPPAEEEAK